MAYYAKSIEDIIVLIYGRPCTNYCKAKDKKLVKYNIYLLLSVANTSVQNASSVSCTIASKISGTSKGVYMSISKLHSILAVTNLLAHNNKSQICYCGQISLQSAAVTAVFLTI